MEINGQKVDHIIELRGVYDGWSVAVLEDGTRFNRWESSPGVPEPGYERRWATTEAFLRGEPAQGRWF